MPAKRAKCVGDNRAQLGGDAFDVFAGAGINLQRVADVDEQWSSDLCAGFQLHRLAHIGGGIAASAWLTVFHLQFDVRWWRDADRLTIEQHAGADHTFLEVLPSVVHFVQRQFVLFEADVVHEYERIHLAIQKLHFDFFDVGSFQSVTTLVNAAQRCSTQQVLQAAFIQGVSLAWLAEIKFNHQPRLAVDLNLDTFAEITCLVRRHSRFPTPQKTKPDSVMLYGPQAGGCGRDDHVHPGQTRRNATLAAIFSLGRCNVNIVTSQSDSVRAGLTSDDGPASTWRQILKRAIRDPAQLLATLDLPTITDERQKGAMAQFPLLVPEGYLARMERGNWQDPLLRQVLPLGEEMAQVPGFVPDAVNDGAAKKQAGLLQKYEGRALLVTTGACAVHCRYCFRRHYPYSEGPRSAADWQPALDELAKDPNLEEILLSGGDPLTIVDEQLAELMRRMAQIPQLKRVRVHTRLPILIPERVTEELIQLLRGTRLVPWMVIHANHTNELDESVAQAVAKLVDAGIPVLNQAVLLAGVNDSLEALVILSKRLLAMRVMPYYLHQLDKVSGTAHFEVPIERGLVLMDDLRNALPGYSVPRYVQEIAGEKSKRILI